MRPKKHGKPRTRLYGLLCAPLILYAWTAAQAQAQTASALADQDPNDVAKITVISTPYTLSFSVSDEDKEKYVIENVTCPAGSAASVAGGQFICENLEPCTSYTTAVSLKGTTESATVFQQNVIAYTDYKEPKTTLTSVEATETTIRLTWETTDRACVKHFEIQANAPDSTNSHQQFKDESSDTFVVLPCRTYNVTLETKNNASVSVGSDMRFVDTGYLEPGELQLTITNGSNADTVVAWKDPINKSCIGSFTIVWRRNGCVSDEDHGTTTATTEQEDDTTTAITDDWTGLTTVFQDTATQSGTRAVECEWSHYSNDSTMKQHTISDLQGCALHTVEVYINADRNTTAKATETFVSGEKLPGAVSEPLEIINSTVLHWSWSPPTDNAQCVANYHVNLTGPTQRSEYASDEQLTSETFATFQNLEPCGIYNVEIVPISANGSRGAGFKSQSTLSEDQPTQILEPSSNTGPYFIELAWLTPSYADLCIGGYRISGWMDDNIEVVALSLSTQNNSVRFDKDLGACQGYTIQIIPYTKQNLDGELRRIEVETKAAIVNYEKIKFELVGNGATPHSLELNANNQDYNNHCQTIFAHFSCQTSVDVPNTYAEKYVESYRDRGFQAVIEPLSPYTKYTCSVVLYNVAGPSGKKIVTGQQLETLTFFPEQPRNVRYHDSTKTSLTFVWEQPKHPNGPIKYYHAFLMRYEADYFVPSTCKAVNEVIKPETKGDMMSTFNDLSPAVKYIMQVAALNDFGLSQYTAPVIGTTQPDVSDPVTDLNVTSDGPALDPTSYSANVTISWTIPCKSNGQIQEFVLHITGVRAERQISYQEGVAPDNHDREGRMSHSITNLLPEVEYTVRVAVKTRNVDTLSASESKVWESPAGLPSGLDDDIVGKMRVSAYDTNHPTSSAIVNLPRDILNSESGKIKYVALLLSQKHCADKPKLTYNVSKSWPPVASWDEVGGDCIHQYQTTPERWNPNDEIHIGRADKSEDITFIIGTDKCPDQTKRYCNGPLKPNTEYHMVVRLFTSSGYNDAALLEFKTEAAIKVTIILVSVCSCLLLAFILGLLVLYVRKRIAWHRDSGQGIEDPFGNVIAKNFALFYAEVAKPEKLAREFKEITVVALELSYAASELGSNKNRYADIYPYDKNRVILDIDTEGSDYINASFIDGHTRKKEYIATQGPKPESVMDFWRMILQHNVRVIVQVTQFREGNTIKCHEYFPYNMRGVTVTIKAKECFDVYDRTELTVVHEKYGLKEKVVHFFFKKWPDHGCPDDPNHLITFVKKVKAEKRPSYSPIVVHCSAGVGRTGTFIGLDLIMQRLKSESKINIFETVKKLRFQRMKMVQTLQQYTFLYSCTYELVKHKIPRAALKLEVRNKTDGGVPPLTAPKKVSFPDTDLSRVEAAVLDSPDPDSGSTAVQLPSRFSGLRRANDLDSLNEQPERNSLQRANGKSSECTI
ncbi:phosphatidylinositol phosphatase PTPRQ [Drosophila navojoa]|uniref:phosphatidylinositol phosphatase PTPRQ n=1 Tax=Drosophila navojoa TaxID=7232 RepID=UPI0008477DC6|nr:phosphatidylinositol phosphatase PTPRQ [Drosophila navojoa]XP_017960655.1 phosphatidylinositol phosphatase PTPRQ [Drosophila navojoa]